MDYLFDALSEPIEISEKIINNISTPDIFRKYLFNRENPITYHNNFETIAKITNTKIKYWSDDYEIIKKLTDLVIKYKSLPEHYLTESFNGKCILSPDLKKYYDKIYNLTDIIITKNIWENNNLIIDMLKQLFNLSDSTIHVKQRICFYLLAHLVNISVKFRKLYFMNTVISKLREFKKNSKIWMFFAENEIREYTRYFKKIYKTEENLLQNESSEITAQNKIPESTLDTYFDLEINSKPITIFALQEILI